jgi:uncharacterized protein Usg
MLIRSTKPVIVDIFYYRPDHPLLIQEFVWGFDDVPPELVRVHQFLNYWKNNIDAVIKEILVGVNDAAPQRIAAVDYLFNLN